MKEHHPIMSDVELMSKDEIQDVLVQKYGIRGILISGKTKEGLRELLEERIKKEESLKKVEEGKKEVQRLVQLEIDCANPNFVKTVSNLKDSFCVFLSQVQRLFSCVSNFGNTGTEDFKHNLIQNGSLYLVHYYKKEELFDWNKFLMKERTLIEIRSFFDDSQQRLWNKSLEKEDVLGASSNFMVLIDSFCKIEAFGWLMTLLQKHKDCFEKDLRDGTEGLKELCR